MKRDFEKTIGNMADKLKTAFIGSVDADGYPNFKAFSGRFYSNFKSEDFTI